MKVSILMATYNGETYLEEQIESILSQTFKSWFLYIRDDGSYDHTLKIINKYVSLYPNKIILVNDKTKHLGAAESFMRLLRYVESDCYMFCDQDDIWLPNKIEECYNSYMQISTHNVTPCLIHTDLKVVDESLNIIDNSFWEYTGLLKYIGNNKALLTKNFITGSTMFFNKISRDLSINNEYNSIIMHDSWVSLCVYANNGTIINLNNSLILYRQHSNNVLGASKKSSRINKLTSLSVLNIFRYYKMVKSATGISFLKYMYLKFIS